MGCLLLNIGLCLEVHKSTGSEKSVDFAAHLYNNYTHYNPEPSFRGQTCSVEQPYKDYVLVITLDMLGRNHTFQYTATNEYIGVKHNRSTILKFISPNTRRVFCVLRCFAINCRRNLHFQKIEMYRYYLPMIKKNCIGYQL